METDRLFNRLVDELGAPGHQQANPYQVKHCSPHDIAIENAGSVTTATLKSSVVKRGRFAHDHEILIRTRGGVSQIPLAQRRVVAYASLAPLSIMTRRSIRFELVARIPAFHAERERKAAYGLAKAALLNQGVWLDMVESDCGIRQSRSDSGTEVAASSHQEMVFQDLEQAMKKAALRDVTRHGLCIEASPLEPSLAALVDARAVALILPMPGIGSSLIRCEVVIPVSTKPRPGLMERIRLSNEKEAMRRTTWMQVAGWTLRRGEISFGTCVPAEAADAQALSLVMDTLMERIERIEWLVHLHPFG